MRKKLLMVLVTVLLTLPNLVKAEMGITYAGRPSTTLSGGDLYLECLNYAQTCCTVWPDNHLIYIWGGNSTGWWVFKSSGEDPDPEITFYAEELEPAERCEECEFDIEP